MAQLEDYDWVKDQIPIKLRLGEIILWSPNFEGVWCNMDIFSSSPFSPKDSPISVMQKENVEVVFAYSIPVSSSLRRMSKINKVIYVVESAFKHYYVETKGEFSNYLASKNKKTISTLQRKTRKVEKTNKKKLAFEVYSSPGEFEEFFRLAFPVSKKSFQHRLFDRGLPDTPEFRSEVLEKSSRGEVLGYILRVDDKPVAYNFCPILNGNTALYDDSGYDPDYGKYSPGSVLQFKIIEELFDRTEIDHYDLCTGEGMHKKMFATDYITCGNIYFCKLTPKYFVLCSLKASLIFFSEFIKKALKIIGQEELKNSIKKFIRQKIVKRTA